MVHNWRRNFSFKNVWESKKGTTLEIWSPKTKWNVSLSPVTGGDILLSKGFKNNESAKKFAYRWMKKEGQTW